ncbi:MAG: endonuclease/exonuclease/phosphatase family protein [Potamolinea sp.]
MPQPKARLETALSTAKLLINVAAGGAFCATLLGFVGNIWWMFELLDHPRPQYCLILLVALVVGGISHQAWSFIWCVPLALNLIVILPLFFTFPEGSNFNAQTNPPLGNTLRIIHANLDRHNLNTTPAIQYIESQNVDLILLQEVTAKWLAKLESDITKYRVVKSLPLEDSLGVAMLVPVTPSQSIEILATQIINLPSYSNRPLIETTVKLGTLKLAILSFSVIRPRNTDTSAFQIVEFDAVSDWSHRQQKENASEVVVIGDFNSTSWSARFRSLLHKSELRNSQRGFGFQPTWPSSLPSWLMIAIDHCLHSKSLRTINRATGPNIGSDHLPLFVELRGRV